MKTFNLAVSFEEVQIVGFATAKGYRESTIVDGEEVANPQTAVQFCEQYFKNFLATEFSTVGMAQIMAQKELEKQEQIAQLQEALKAGITISVE